MEFSTNLILPRPRTFDIMNLLFSNEQTTLEPYEFARVVQWIFFGKYTEHLRDKNKEIAPGQNEFWSFTDRIQGEIFCTIQDFLDQEKGHITTSASRYDITTGEVFPDHIRQNITLQTIATNIKKFTIPDDIRFLSSDCVNQNSNMEELVFSAKLSGQYLRSAGSATKHDCDKTCPAVMLYNMPKLQTISFTDKPYRIEKMDYRGQHKYRILVKMVNILGLDFTFEIENHNRVVFLQIDKTGEKIPFKYEHADSELTMNQSIELGKTRLRPYQGKDLVVYTDSINITNLKYTLDILYKLNDQESHIFKNNPDAHWQKHLIRSCALQTKKFDLPLCTTEVATNNSNLIKKANGYNMMFNPQYVSPHEVPMEDIELYEHAPTTKLFDYYRILSPHAAYDYLMEKMFFTNWHPFQLDQDKANDWVLAKMYDISTQNQFAIRQKNMKQFISNCKS